MSRLWLALAWGDHRLPGSSSPTRLLIYRLVVRSPGITITNLARQAGVHWGAANFHVVRLAAAGLVRTYRVGRHRLVFSADAVEGEWPEERVALGEPSCRRLALALLEEPGQSVGALVERTGLSHRVVYHHVKRMMELGLVSKGQGWFYRALRPTPKLYGLLLQPEA